MDSVLRITDALPNVVVIRTFSKVYGLSGLRAGYAVGSESATRMLDAISPVLGVNALTQSAIEQALKIGGPEVERRRAAVIEQRQRVEAALRVLPVERDAKPGELPLDQGRRACRASNSPNRLRKEGVVVAPGGPLGADDHIRATIRDAAAGDRLLAAVEHATVAQR